MGRKNINTNEWYDLLESKIYNKVAKRITKENGSDVFCTTDEVNIADTEFPTVWVHELEYPERGMDLTNTSINAVLYNMQIDVYSKDKAESKKIMRFAVSEMKELCFNVISMPLTMQIGADLYHTVARFRRMIGGGDKI